MVQGCLRSFFASSVLSFYKKGHNNCNFWCKAQTTLMGHHKCYLEKHRTWPFCFCLGLPAWSFFYLPFSPFIFSVWTYTIILCFTNRELKTPWPQERVLKDGPRLGAKALRKGYEVPHVVGAMSWAKLKCPEEGGPHVEWILIGNQNLSTGVLR